MQQDLIAGDTLNFATSLADYPAGAGWVLKFRLVPRTAGNPAIALTAAAEGDDHRTSVTAAATAGWAADAYGWTSWVEKGAEVYSVDSGQITVRPNPRTVAAGTDTRSQAERALADLRLALSAWSPLRRRYRIGDREMEFNAPADIIRMITWWEGQVAAEALLAGRIDKPSRRIYTRI